MLPCTLTLGSLPHSRSTPRYFFFDIINFTFKLVLWATLVFFSYGSQLQLGTALLLCVGRLALHAQFEPYRTAMNNVFDYVTLIITALFGLGGIMLQSLETSKNLAINKNDDVGIERSRTALGVVDLALNIMVRAKRGRWAQPAERVERECCGGVTSWV